MPTFPRRPGPATTAACPTPSPRTWSDNYEGRQTMQLHPYDVGVFHGLSDFFVAREMTDGLGSSIMALGDVIRSFKLEGHVGLCLLHQHYQIADNEYVLREFEGSTAYMRPTTTP